jgi:hypothetical protein
VSCAIRTHSISDDGVRHLLGYSRGSAGARKTRILHLGDYDPSGVHLFSSLAEDIIAFAAAAGAEVEFERAAVTAEQVVTYDLPTAPPKPTDQRSFSGTATTQAEAGRWCCPGQP